MMVLPIQQGGNGKKRKGGKKGGGDVQVNLIVDPGKLQGQQDERHKEYDQDEYDEQSSVPGTYSPYAHRRSSPQCRTRPRRSVFVGLAMEQQWRSARAYLKKLMFFDIACVVLWGAEFMLILIGKKCPSGAFQGWCNAYNVACAGACLLFVGFGFSIFFDIKDLHDSRASPRTRP